MVACTATTQINYANLLLWRRRNFDPTHQIPHAQTLIPYPQIYCPQIVNSFLHLTRFFFSKKNIKNPQNEPKNAIPTVKKNECPVIFVLRLASGGPIKLVSDVLTSLFFA